MCDNLQQALLHLGCGLQGAHKHRVRTIKRALIIIFNPSLQQIKNNFSKCWKVGFKSLFKSISPYWNKTKTQKGFRTLHTTTGEMQSLFLVWICLRWECKVTDILYVPLENVLCKHGSSWLSHYRRKHLIGPGYEKAKHNKLVHCNWSTQRHLLLLLLHSSLHFSSKLLNGDEEWLCHRGHRSSLEMASGQFSSIQPTHTRRLLTNSLSVTERGFWGQHQRYFWCQPARQHSGLVALKLLKLQSRWISLSGFDVSL